MDKLKLYYVDIKNMGDQLNIMLMRDVFGYEAERCSYLTGELSAIGSGLDQYMLHGSKADKLRQRLYGTVYPRVDVWGTGFINSHGDTAFYKRNMRFHAVRGKLSRQRAERLLGRTLDIPTGDGGILADMLIEPQSKTMELGIVPHVCDLHEPLIGSLKARFGKDCIIDVRGEPYEVLRRIARCRVILSSSLHGLIAADSFGIPNRHVLLSDKPKGDGFKFRDYYSAYDLRHPVTDLRREPVCSPEEIVREYPITAEMVAEKKALMLSAFPYPIRK